MTASIRRRGSWRVAALVPVALAVTLGAGPRTEPATPGTEASQGVASEGPEKTIKLYVEKWRWSPNTIRVKRGTRLVLVMESRDASRMFFLPAYKLKVRIPQSKTVRAEFVANRVGKFPWRCKLPCGDGCSKLRGTLIVEE